MTDVSRGIRRIARIDLEAFATNVAGASVLDVRADAYGHSIALVGPVAREAGVSSLVVSDEADAAAARAVGFTDLHIGRLLRDVGALGAEAYGLDDAGTPVLTLVGEVISIKHVGADAGVSYGYTYRTEAPTCLALIALGYADGVPRLASNRASVRVGSDIHPLVGRIAMDQFVVDCGDDVPAAGSEAVLFGDPGTGATSTHDWATATERHPLQLTAGLGARVMRIAR
ncbi:MAG: alanine racemase [Schumannella sp.]|nr:alanine racemase [Schumannella sp.]